MTLIVNNYLREERFQYKDETTKFELVDGDYWYFIEIEKLLNNELLKADKFNALQLNADEVELPAGTGICYTGMGVQMEFNGKRFDMTEANQDIVQNALKSGNAKWYWNKDRFKKYGGTDTATLNVYATDKAGDKTPNFQLTVNKTVR